MKGLHLIKSLAVCFIILITGTAHGVAINTETDYNPSKREGLYSSPEIPIINSVIEAGRDGQPYNIEYMVFHSKNETGYLSKQYGNDIKPITWTRQEVHNIPRHTVPEPKTLFLLGSGLIGFAGVVRKRVIS